MATPRPLRTQMLLLQLGVVGVTVVVASVMALWLHARAVTQSTQEHLRSTAVAFAALPSVQRGFSSPDPPGAIQQVAELVRRSGAASQVVVTDVVGRRYSHPNPALIGTVDPFDPDVPQAGEITMGVVPGVMGEAIRVKVPVYGPEGAVIGSVSAGLATSALRAEMWGAAPALAPWLIGVGLSGSLGALVVSARLWRQVHRQEPREIAEALQAREAVLHAIGEAVVVVDAGGKVTLINDEAVRLLGLHTSDVGRRAAEVLDPGFQAGRSLDGARSPAHLALARERLVVAHHACASVDGEEVATVLVARDRSELQSALDSLAGARSLTEALRSQAHEFAGRMHVIAGLLELGEIGEARGYVTELCSRDAALERQLLQIPDPRLRALLLAKVTVAAERDVAVSVHVGAGLEAWAPSDAATVVSNLLDNAIDAVEAGGTIEITMENLDAGGLRVVVSDDGPGIAPELRDQVTQTGFTTKGGGRGFGLALVERIARRRGGAVRVGTSERGGAQVEVALPVPDAVAPHEPGRRDVVGAGVGEGGGQ